MWTTPIARLSLVDHLLKIIEYVIYIYCSRLVCAFLVTISLNRYFSAHGKMVNCESGNEDGAFHSNRFISSWDVGMCVVL